MIFSIRVGEKSNSKWPVCYEWSIVMEDKKLVDLKCELKLPSS